jgi:beta-lactamase regulating signal transducer with metallopeptidase domain
MSLDLALRNLLAWSVQVGVLGLAAALVARWLPLERPSPRLAFHQGLLLLVLGLPLVQPWQALRGSVSWAGVWPAAPEARAVPGETLAAGLQAWPVLVAVVLAAGALFQLARLALRLARLRALRRSAPNLHAPPWLSALRDEVAPTARLVTSPAVATAAAFGLRRPVVVFPPMFASLARDRQEAIALHELLHVRRGDWLSVLAEEVLKALLFFHPCVHWLVDRVRLAREQAVDAAAVARLGGSRAYVESLLEVARRAVRARAVPAAPFLRESHLRERVDLLLKETAMSRTRHAVHAFATVAVLAAAVTGAVAAAPLLWASAHAAGAEPAPYEPKLLHKVNPSYPAEAKSDKAEGVFLIAAVLGTDGRIQGARVKASAPTLERFEAIKARTGGSSLEGDARLADAALAAVKQWRYEPVVKNGRPVEANLDLTIRFRLD